MRAFLFILFVLAHLFTVIGQKQLNKNPKLLTLKGNTNCVYKQKYSVAQRNEFYPFNITDTIRLVSFRYHGKKNYPISKDSLVVDSLIEIKVLSTKEIETLTDILYNNFYKKDPNYGLMAQCYIPHNAILFFDKAGKLKEFISICFHCANSEASSEKIRLGDNCDQKMDKLRSFFISSGVQFGTDPNIEYGGGKEEGIVAPPKD